MVRAVQRALVRSCVCGSIACADVRMRIYPRPPCAADYCSTLMYEAHSHTFSKNYRAKEGEGWHKHHHSQKIRVTWRDVPGIIMNL